MDVEAAKALRRAEKKARKAVAASAGEGEESNVTKGSSSVGDKRKVPTGGFDTEPAVPSTAPAEDEAEVAADRAARKAAKRARKAAVAAEAAETEEAATADGVSAIVAGEAVPAETKEEIKARKKAVRRAAAAHAEAGSGGATTGASGWPCYKPAPEVLAQSAAQVAAFHTEKAISVLDPLVPAANAAAGAGGASAAAAPSAAGLAWKPVAEFAWAHASFGPTLLACTSAFKEPSPIQAQAWPVLLSGRDMIGIAATGSGKTLAFLLPAFLHIAARLKALAGGAGGAASAAAGAGKRSGAVCRPTVLVLAPTRELAMQTAKVAGDVEAAAATTGRLPRTVCVYGGVPKHTQRDEMLGAGAFAGAGGPAAIVVATPGRLLDHLQEGTLDLSRCTYLVLDEADRMLDMGFEKDIRTVIAALPPASAATRGTAGADGSSRQTLMFSATWPPAIQAIAAEFLASPVQVVVGSAELAANHAVTQVVEVVEPGARDALLLRLLAKYHGSRRNRVLVFVLYKKEADRVERMLSGRGWACGAIHGDLSQEARTRAFHAFKEARVPLLIATDVAARGLDIPQVEYVINYSFPLTIEDYVHRIGRTGRGGATGTAHTMFTQLDKAHAGELANVLREAGAPVPDALTRFGTHVKKKEHALYGAHFKGGGGGPAPPASRMRFDDD